MRRLNQMLVGHKNLYSRDFISFLKLIQVADGESFEWKQRKFCVASFEANLKLQALNDKVHSLSKTQITSEMLWLLKSYFNLRTEQQWLCGLNLHIAQGFSPSYNLIRFYLWFFLSKCCVKCKILSCFHQVNVNYLSESRGFKWKLMRLEILIAIHFEM